MASLFFVKENGVSSQSLIIRRKKTVEQETSGLVSMVLGFQIYQELIHGADHFAVVFSPSFSPT